MQTAQYPRASRNVTPGNSGGSRAFAIIASVSAGATESPNASTSARPTFDHPGASPCTHRRPRVLLAAGQRDTEKRARGVELLLVHRLAGQRR
jgi:hypothetical protein